MRYRVDVQESDGSRTTQKFATYDEAAEYVTFVFDASSEDDSPPTVNLSRDVPGAAVTDGNPGGIDVDTVIERTIGSTDHQFVIEQTEYGYAARYGSKDHFGSRWFHYPSVEFPTKDEAAAYAERFLSTAEENVANAGITEGNPDGIGDPVLDEIIAEGTDVQTAGDASGHTISWTEDGERHTIFVDEAGSLTHWDSTGIINYEPGAGIVNGNPDGIGDEAPDTRKVTLNSGEVFYAPSAAAAAQIAEEERALMGQEAEVIVEGNPDGIELEPDVVIVADKRVDGRIEVTVRKIRTVDGTWYMTSAWDNENPENRSVEGAYDIETAKGLMGRVAEAVNANITVTDGNPGGEPLHESLAEVAAQIDYEAEVVAAAADEVESEEISDAADAQAEAMDDAAEAVSDAAEVAAETAAEVFTETGTASSDVAKTDTPEGDVISGHPDTTPDVPPEPMHWYRRRIGAYR